MGDFSHLNAAGEANMVDVSDKQQTLRQARVSGCVEVSASCASRLTNESLREIESTARIAGIQAAKRTSELIPLCHQVALNKVEIEIKFLREEMRFAIIATAKSSGVTGVEMESFCAAQIAGLTVYDMIKAVCPEAVLGRFRLEEKTGGKAGVWRRSES